MTKSKYFFCYNKRVSDYLRTKQLNFITVAIDPKSNKMYSMYEITPELQKALDEYKSINS